MKNFKIRTQLLIVTLATSLIPFIIIGGVAMWSCQQAIDQQAFSHLESVRETKKAQINRFFSRTQANMSILLEMVSVSWQNARQKLQSVQESKKAQLESYFQERLVDLHAVAESDLIAQTMEQFAEAFTAENHKIKGAAWQTAVDRFGKELASYRLKQGYHDLLLITPAGDIIYTAAQGTDLGQNLVTGDLKDSPLGKGFQKTVDRKKPSLQDFDAYLPAASQYIAFLMTPIFLHQEFIGVLALGISAQSINKIVQRREGMGSTEGTYLVGELNGRISYRSDRVYKWQNREAIGQEVTGTDIEEALAGNSGLLVQEDTDGLLRLSAYSPLQIPGLHWGIITSMSLEEILTPKLTGEQADFFTKFTIQHQLYDLSLVHGSGKIFYTVKHEDDYGTNILTGKYADSHLSRLVQLVLDSKTFQISDYAPYPPSQNAPAAFVAQPLMRDGNVELVVVLQLASNSLDSIMQQREGMGKTGDSYLVGSDKLMRSNSFLAHDTHSMEISFAHPEKGYIDTDSSRAALRGETGKQIITNADGMVVLSAYTPLIVGNYTWALLVEIHQAEAFARLNTLQWLIGTLALVFGLLILIFSRRFVHQFIAPLLQVNDHLKTLAQGKVTAETIHYPGDNEIAEIVSSFQNLKIAIRSTIAQANSIAAGNYDITVHLLSYDDQLGHALTEMVHTLRGVVKQANAIATGNYNEKVKPLSDQDQLGMALSQMTLKLRDMMAQNAQQDWLKTGLMQLSQQISGKQDTVSLAKNIIHFLCTYLSAQVGVFYVVEQPNVAEHSDAAPQTPYLKLLASYAYTWRKNLANRFEFGEGMVGQAALEQQPIIIHQVPSDAIQVQSGLMDTTPRQVVVTPYLFEDAVKGVIELGLFNDVTPLQIEFLNQVLPDIAVAINTAESRTQLQELLQQSQIQTEELQSQAEELQSQQEELRQANEELEEHSRELKQQQHEITETNRVLEQSRQVLENKAKELELASKYKSEFLANMSHELRTPLNSLLILAQILADNKPGNLTDKQVEYARTIHSAGTDLLTLINDILDLSKVEAGKLEVVREALVLKDLLDATEQKFQPVAEQKGLTFTLSADDPHWSPILHTDSQRLKQILNNLLSNALKFTARGVVKLHIGRPLPQEVATLGVDPHQTIAIRVTDSGIGIPKNKQELVFDAFRQADGTTSRRYGGTGLGLSISRQLARLLGGEICLTSEEGKGSTFTLYLPLSKMSQDLKTVAKPTASESSKTVTIATLPIVSESNQVSTPNSLAVTPSNTLEVFKTPNGYSSKPTEVLGATEVIDDRDTLTPSSKTILIIEDDRKFSTILMELTRDKHFKCLLAEDGKMGLQLAETYQPSAIILDIGLPQIDGWSVMEKLKDNPKTRHIPVHFMSASHKDQEAKQMGAIGFLLKPINMAELSEAFKKIEDFLAKTVKHLLIVADDLPHQQKILDLVGNHNIQSVLAPTSQIALDKLHQGTFDCLILDIDVENDTGLHLLEQLYEDPEHFSQIPVILYAERDLTPSEEELLQSCSDHLTVKTVKSPERLLDEATLFLHQLESNLSKEKRTMLHKLHDKEAILAGKKVLLVDDDMRNTFALTTVLEEKNMDVFIAENGQEALNLLKEQPSIDIILMDVMMPEMDGYETMKQIRAQPRFRKLPILALTAKAMKGDKNKCLEAGANDYLAKPIDADKLISLMRVWLYR